MYHKGHMYCAKCTWVTTPPGGDVKVHKVNQLLFSYKIDDCEKYNKHIWENTNTWHIEKTSNVWDFNRLTRQLFIQKAKGQRLFSNSLNPGNGHTERSTKAWDHKRSNIIIISLDRLTEPHVSYIIVVLLLGTTPTKQLPENKHNNFVPRSSMAKPTPPSFVIDHDHLSTVICVHNTPVW